MSAWSTSVTVSMLERVLRLIAMFGKARRTSVAMLEKQPNMSMAIPSYQPTDSSCVFSPRSADSPVCRMNPPVDGLLQHLPIPRPANQCTRTGFRQVSRAPKRGGLLAETPASAETMLELSLSII